MFGFIKNALHKIYSSVTKPLHNLFNKSLIDQEILRELEVILLGADTGVATTRMIIEKLKEKSSQSEIKTGQDLKKSLEAILLELLLKQSPSYDQKVKLLIGVNGSGKTTFAGKYAHFLHKQGKKVLLVAADTFRVAAVEQLKVWADTAGVAMVMGTEHQDPASVVFKGCKMFVDGGYDVIIIDTAGRLQTKIPLMQELKKIRTVVERFFDRDQIATLLTIDAMLGQNSFQQAQLFNEATDVDGIVLTKVDGTGKGGTVFAIADKLSIPVAYLSYGETIDDLKPFNPQEYVYDLLNK